MRYVRTRALSGWRLQLVACTIGRLERSRPERVSLEFLKINAGNGVARHLPMDSLAQLVALRRPHRRRVYIGINLLSPRFILSAEIASPE